MYNICGMLIDPTFSGTTAGGMAHLSILLIILKEVTQSTCNQTYGSTYIVIGISRFDYICCFSYMYIVHISVRNAKEQ